MAKSADMTIPLLAGDTWDNNRIVESAQGSTLPIFISTFYQEGATPQFDESIRSYLSEDPARLEQNGGDLLVSAVSAMGYDAYFVALEAIRLAGSSDPREIQEALWSVSYEGVSGHIVFDAENGDALRSTAFIKTVDTEENTWVFVRNQTVH